jgi:hypothetical protein
MFAFPISEYHLDVGTLASYEAAQTGWPGLRRYGGVPSVA